ncbi:MAG: rod-binding protein [Treponema sp.]|nr:rod-binding protein [Treponema sp.]
MDINSVASTYLDNYRMSAPVNGITDFNAQKSTETFADILKRAAAPAQNDSQAAGAQTQESAVSRKAHIDKTDKLYEQCQALETFIVKTLVDGMRNTIQKSGFIDEGFAGKMYEDMLYDEYSKELTKNAGFGLADQAYLELTGQRGKAVPVINS